MQPFEFAAIMVSQSLLGMILVGSEI